jgi:hypothetical protein
MADRTGASVRQGGGRTARAVPSRTQETKAGARPRILAGALCSAAALGWLACGGTTGHEDLPVEQGPGGADATVADGGVTADATVEAGDEGDFGAFDADIMYADQVLPEVNAAPPMTDAGEAGYPWPNCPPFIPVRNGKPTTLAAANSEIPADYAADGAVVAAADGSVCASYGWLGSTSVDQCAVVNGYGTDTDNPLLPPCNWCVDAGVAVQGPQAGRSRYLNCLDLYACMVSTGCGSIATTCLCGSQDTVDCESNMNPSGPCATQELASLEEVASQAGAVQMAILNYTDVTNCAGALNNVFETAAQYSCFPADAATP